MPACGSQIVLCDLPIRFDTYIGCTHGCTYCFAAKKRNMKIVVRGESPKALRSFIEGKRAKVTSWCDWNIPLHWGGTSDPFQPVEKKFRNSFECLKVLAETNYPAVFSTKGRIAVDEEYLSVMRDCNIAAQVSMVDTAYDVLEPGAPKFSERMSMLEPLAKNTKRVIVRVSPYSAGLADAVCSHLKDYKDRGVYGIEVEGMKRQSKKPGFVKVGGDYCYPVGLLRDQFIQIKEACKAVGLVFFCGENRLRYMSEDRCCCGVGNLPGFIPNKANLNSLVFNNPLEYTQCMKAQNSGYVFRCFVQEDILGSLTHVTSYAELMDIMSRSKTYMIALGLMAGE